MTLRSLAFSMLCLLTLIRAEDGIPFPGPAISATTTNVTGRELTIGNNTLTATFVREGPQLRLATLRSPLNGLDVAWSDPNLFTIHRTSGDAPLTSSAMKLVAGPEVRAFVGIPGAARLADRLSGCQLQATFRDESSGVTVQWHAVMTNGSNTLLQKIRLLATHRPVEIDRIEMIRATLPGAQVAGYTDGSPITTDKLFLGIEHPMARNLAETGGGSSRAEMPAKQFDVPVTGATIVKAVATVCALPRQCALEPGTEWSVSSGIGVYPAGQLRRAFLYYLERERAHPYRQYWHYNSSSTAPSAPGPRLIGRGSPTACGGRARIVPMPARAMPANAGSPIATKEFTRVSRDPARSIRSTR